LYGLGIIVLLLLGLGAAVRMYLSSDRLARQVAARVQQVLGGNVHIGGIHVGMTGGSSLKGLEAYQGAGDTGEKPWIEIPELDADVDALELARGTIPQTVHVRDPRLTLHFAANDHLLTRLPSMRPTPGLRLPTVAMAGGQLTIEQDGRPPLVVQGINATLTGPGPAAHIQGTVDDPSWGHWDAEAGYDPDTRRFSLRLQSGRRHVTMQQLRALPFISRKVWQEVQLEGETPVVFTLTFEPPGGGGTPARGTSYRIDLEPRDTTVHVSSIDLDADHASGKLTVHDKVVDLAGVRGRAAGGEIRTDAVLDFRPPEGSVLDFKIDVAGLLLHALPQSWRIPRKFDGKLTGHADLRWTIVRGKALPRGTGEGRIDDPRLGPIRLKKPIRISLHADEKGLHYGLPKDEPSAALPLLRAIALVAPQPAERSLVDELVGDAVDVPITFARAVGRTTVRVLDAASSAAGRIARAARHAAGAPHDYFEADLSLADVNIGDLLAGLGVKVPFTLSGKVTVRIHVGMPLDAPRDFKAYRVRGSATLPWLDVAGVRLTDVKARLRYEDGLAQLSELSGRVPSGARGGTPAGGTFAGTARLQVVPVGDLSADLRIDRILLARLLGSLAGGATEVEGSVSGSVNAHARADRLQDPAAWRASTQLHSDRLWASGLSWTDAGAHVAVGDGVAHLTELGGRLEGAAVGGSGELRLAAPYRYTARLHLDGMDLSGLEHLAPTLHPPADVAGTLAVSADVRGQLHSANLEASGSASASTVRVDGVALDSLACDWSAGRRELELRNIRARINGGKVSGTATVPLLSDAAGRADLRLRDVNAARLLRAMPNMPVRVEGELSGTLQASVTAAASGRPRAFSTRLELTAPRLGVQGIPAERLRGDIDYKNGAGEYDLQGDALGGRFRLDGKLPARPEQAAPPPAGGGEAPPDGRLRVEDVRLGRLARALGWRGATGALRGALSLDLPYRHEGPDRVPVGQGTFRISGFRWDDLDLSDGVQGDVRVGPSGLEFRNVSGALAQGLLRASLVLPVGSRGGGSFSLSLIQADAAQLLRPWPGLDDHIQGSVDASLRGRIGDGWYGGGSMVLSRGRVFGVEVNEWRLPLRFAFSPQEGQGELNIDDSSAAPAMGRAVGRARLNWNYGARLDGNLRFFDVEVRSLLTGAGDFSTVASGRLAGRIDFDGTEIHSANDITAAISATLSQAQAMQVPVLRQIVPFLRGGVASGTFQSGQLEARLSRGLIRLQRLTLQGGLLAMIVEGTITLEGRLNLEVTARTGGSPLLAPGLRLLALSAPLAGALPVTLISEASLLLANRVVHLRVTGTLHNPIVQIEPVRLLTEEAVRYFLTRALLGGL
jgi:hypothetical protein